MRKFTIITGHGKLDFVERDGKFEFLSVNDRPLSKLGKLGTNRENKSANEDNLLHSQGKSS
jgi:hypothetical protein